MIKQAEAARFLTGMIGFVALLTTVLLMVPGVAYADSGASSKTIMSEAFVNPLYEGVIDELTESESADAGSGGIGALTTSATSDAPYFDKKSDAVDYIYDQMIARKAKIEILMDLARFDDEPNLPKDLFDAAIAHTGEPKGGDYLLYQMGSWEIFAEQYSSDKAIITYEIKFLTTAAQEAKVDMKVSQIVSQLGLKDLGEYERVIAIYIYITSHVSYDYANLNNNDYPLKYSAYAALFNGKALCQGYAALFYRLACECGLSARAISGKAAKDEDHAWNIVRIGDVFYNVDSTWDAGKASGNYSFLLKSDASFSDRKRDAEYATSAFYRDYPMSKVDYKIPAESGGSKISQTITLPKTAITKAYGNKPFNLKAQTSGDGILKYKSSDDKVAAVSTKGTVVIKGVGKTTISVYAAASAMCEKSETKTVTITVKKGTNPMTVKGKTAAVGRSAVKVSNLVLARSKVLKVSGAEGKVTYAKASGNKKISINKKTGKVTVKKGLGKGTYKVKVKVKAAGTGKYKALAKKVTFKIKVA